MLALDAVVDGVPEVLVGDGALDARVRWLHVSDSAGVARLLDGGELLLSTGSSWPADPDVLRRFIFELADAGLSGLVLELGTHYPAVPPVVIDAASRRGLALVALHREVKFVGLTQAVHRRIIAGQMDALRARDEVRERFTALVLRGSPADFIVHQLAQTLAAPVILENLAHEVVAAEVPLAREEELFTDWELQSRSARRRADQRGERGAEPAPEDWLVVPVEARGVRWGRLVALPGPEHAAGRTAVLEQGAIALAVGRLADGGSDEWGRIGRRRLVDGLLAGGSPASAGRRRGSRPPACRSTDRCCSASWSRGRRSRLNQRMPRHGISEGVRSPALRRQASRCRHPRSCCRSRRLRRSTTRPRWRSRAPGGTGRRRREAGRVGRQRAAGLEAALASLHEAVDLARDRRRRSGRGPHLRRAESRPLVQLVAALRDDHRVLEHGERMLAPLVDYDLTRGGDLLDVLEAMLSHPGNRTAAASASHLSRSVFYQRIAMLEELLDANLDDGETQTALHLALLVRRSAGR